MVSCFHWCRMLAKQVQTELAAANSVADEVLSTMTTVRAHAADDSAKAAYAVKLAKFYILQVRRRRGSFNTCLIAAKQYVCGVVMVYECLSHSCCSGVKVSCVFCQEMARCCDAPHCVWLHGTGTCAWTMLQQW